MSSYRTADRLFPGCHQASLFIGMEYLRTNNLKTALMSFQAAMKLNQTDPQVYNEMAVVFFNKENY